MAKSRAQRKAEQRKKRQQGLEERARQKQAEAREEESHAQHDTQVPHSADVDEVDAALAAGAAEAEALAPSRADVGRPEQAEGDGDGAVAEAEVGEQISRRERRRAEKEQRRRARESAERRAPKEAKPEKERGRVASFLVSVVRELQRVQWPDRDTLVQASAVTVIFVAVAAAYLGALDAVFERLVELIL